MPLDLQRAGKGHLDLAADQVLHHGRLALVGHVHHVGVLRQAHVRAGQVRVGADAVRAVRHLALVGGHVLEQFRPGLGRHAGVDHQHQRRHGDAVDHGQVLLRVVRQLGVEELVGHQRVGQAQHDGVAIGRRLGHRVGADDAGRARLVVDHHRLTQLRRQLLPDHARHHVGGATGLEGHDHLDRLGRIVDLRAGVECY